jgi:nucleoside phosphorylase
MTTRGESFRDACVSIRKPGQGSRGSGFLITQRHVFTASHLVRPLDGEFEVVLSTGETVPSRLLALDEAIGCAVLETAAAVEDVTPIPVGFDVAPGDTGTLTGYSESLGKGTSSLSFQVSIQDVLRDAKLPTGQALVVLPPPQLGPGFFRGFSGAPLLVASRVVGVLWGQLNSHDAAILLCIRIQDALRLLPAEVLPRLSPPEPEKQAGEPATKGSTVLCLSALDEELDYLYDMPLNWSAVHLRTDGLSFRRGELHADVAIIAASARGMGLVATAVLAAKAMKEWSPTVAMMIGICGGRKEKGVSIGDIVAPDQCFHYQFGAFRDGRIQRELRSENTEGQIIDLIDHMRRTQVLAEIQRTLPLGFKSPKTILQCHVAPMASADLVVKDTQKFDEAIEADRKTLAVDMESYAFLRAAKLTAVRWAFVSKGVTDFADAVKDDEYREYAKYVSTHFAVRLARALVAGLAT